MKKYDAIMIGFGKGAKTLAARLAAEGQTVAVVEKSEKMYGGTCINVGCIPSKSLVNSAALQQSAERRYAGTAVGEALLAARPGFFASAMAEKERLTGALREKNYAKLSNLPGVDVITGTASFVSANEITVKTKDGTQKLWGEKLFVNTGSRAFVPPIDGVEGARVYTSETLLDLKEFPERLVIVGGGYIGMEFASFFNGFGSKVTVLTDGETFLPREEPEIAAEIQKVLKAKGIDFRFGVRVTAIADGVTAATVIATEKGEPQKYDAEAVLIATGRRPNTEGLNLAAAGVAVTERGAVQVDGFLRTTAPNIYAMGDVKGGEQFTYISLDDYRIVYSALKGGGRTTANRGAVPYSVFLAPPFSRVGLTLAEAIEQGYDAVSATLPAAAIPKAQVLRQPEGLLKAVVDRKSRRVLGVSLFCAESYEMINTVKLAMDLNADYTVLRDQIFTHPTMSEALNDLFGAIRL